MAASARVALLLLSLGSFGAGAASARALPARLQEPLAQEAAEPAPAAVEWDARAAEHLLNRAGFGAPAHEIERAVLRGHAGLLHELLGGDPFHERPFYARVRAERGLEAYLAGLPPEERRVEVRRLRNEDDEQLRDFLTWWVERMLDGEDPLRERMTLFWHGFFTSSQQDVNNSYEMIMQNQFLRKNALGSFAHLVHGIARDPAMLEYLDNDESRRGSPNENFARELMELFTLGEGHYTEQDVQEAARAFTGWTDRHGRFRYNVEKHDDGEKTVLGVTGRLDGDDVIEVLLAQDACARHLARHLLAYFEGVEPDVARLEAYAALLRREEYEVAPFLEHLFGDPAFYRDEVVGTRISSPIDFLVGAARRLGCEPPARLVLIGAAALGQRLFDPPNVQGWEEGPAWITTSTLMQRGNLAGVLLEQVRLRDFVDGAPGGDPAPSAETMTGPVMDEAEMQAPEMTDWQGPREPPPFPARELGELKGLQRLDWRPRLNLAAELNYAAVRGDQEVVDALLDRLLAVEVSAATRAELLLLVSREREALGLEEGELLEEEWRAEPLLRRVAHVILSLPEAQLH